MSAPPPTAAPAALDTATVARAVREVLPTIRPEDAPSGRGSLGRFGPEKVYISAIWRRVSQDPRFRGMTPAQFKRVLLDANRRHELELARADLVGAMDPGEVRDSEIEDMGATFHFVVDPDAKMPWERNPPRGKVGPPPGRPLTADEARILVKVRTVAPYILSEGGAVRQKGIVDRGLQTGIVDSDIETILEIYDEPTLDATLDLQRKEESGEIDRFRREEQNREERNRRGR